LLIAMGVEIFFLIIIRTAAAIETPPGRRGGSAVAIIVMEFIRKKEIATRTVSRSFDITGPTTRS